MNAIALILVLLLDRAVPTTQPPERLAPVASRAVAVEWTFDVSPEGARSVSLVSLLPRTLADRQTVRRMDITPPPVERFFDGGNEYARFELNDLSGPTTIRIAAEIDLFRCDLSTATRAAERRGRVRPATQPATRAAEAYLAPERFIESDAPRVRALAAQVRDLAPAGRVVMLRNLQETVLERLDPAGYLPRDNGAVWAIDNGKGDCSEYSDLFVALCRAKGIPARVIEGFLITPTPDGDSPKHAWTEVYIDPGRGAVPGWVPFDLYHTEARWAAFDQLDPTRIALSVKRNDAILHGHHHFVFTSRGGRAEVVDRFTVVRVSSR